MASPHLLQVANDQVRDNQRIEIQEVVTEAGTVNVARGEHEQPQVATLFYNLGDQIQGQAVNDQRPDHPQRGTSSRAVGKRRREFHLPIPTAHGARGAATNVHGGGNRPHGTRGRKGTRQEKEEEREGGREAEMGG